MFTPEQQELQSLLAEKARLVAMLAPSFVIDFEYPQIVGMLKRLGFSYVVEVAVGAAETNRQLLDLVRLHPNRRFITSPCPTIVRLIRKKYPELDEFFAWTDSPMSATAKLVQTKYPGYRPVFIGPCFAKKLEAKEDRADLNILVLTYKELQEVINHFGLKPQPGDEMTTFDEVGKSTRLYPVSGGLAQSARLNEILTDEEYDVISGPELAEKTLQEFPNSKLRVLDILYCDGGCISGPGIVNQLNIHKRRQKVIAHWAKGVA